MTTCPDCKGTGVYVGLGFTPAEPCRACAAPKPASVPPEDKDMSVVRFRYIAGNIAHHTDVSLVCVRTWPVTQQVEVTIEDGGGMYEFAINLHEAVESRGWRLCGPDFIDNVPLKVVPKS